MRYSLLCFIFSVFTLTACHSQSSNSGTWSVIDIPAPSLSHSMLESDANKAIGIYLPPSYETSHAKNYPVVYFLEGYSSGIYDKGYTCWILDTLIQKKQVPEMIMVNVSGRYSMGGSFYENSPVTGNWEDFVVNDVVNYIDNNYRTIQKPESRAITGHSMGGYGALNLAMLHPNVFKVTYSMSPGAFDEDGLAQCQIFRNGGTIQPILELLEKLKPLNKEDAHKAYMDYITNIKDWNIEFTLAYGMTFAPNTSKAPYFDYPLSVNGSDTIRNEQIWLKWEKGYGGIENDIDNYQNNLKALNLLAIDCGYNDDFAWITEGTIYYSDLLTDKQLPHIMNWHLGTHGSRYTESIQFGLFPTVASILHFK